jgi:6-pyruvoyl-tetrahydropterin synthase
MALSINSLKQAIKAEVLSTLDSANENDNSLDQFSEALARAIVNHIVNNLTIRIPSATVITSVTGQAVGVPNVTPISCTVS